MAKEKNNQSAGLLSRLENSMDGVQIGDDLNSDNAFSDAGLENARTLEKSSKNINSQKLNKPM